MLSLTMALLRSPALHRGLVLQLDFAGFGWAVGGTAAVNFLVIAEKGGVSAEAVLPACISGIDLIVQRLLYHLQLLQHDILLRGYIHVLCKAMVEITGADKQILA